jgi:CheY-like chemotaxis protein
MKDEFLAILSHELRTPMTAVLGWLHVARSGKLTPEQQDKALETVERNARLQTQLIEDLLDVSRIVTGKLQREDEAVPIDRVVESAIETARLAAGARRIELTSDIEPGKWVVQGSPARLGQIFNNLLSNAVKFSPEGGRIDVRVERGDGHVRATVTDQGEGLAPELLARVFDSFRQADSSTRRRHGGLGLGLAIVKSLVELHGGTVAVESAGVGRGASFIVTLPLLLNEGKPQAKPSMPSAAVESLHGLHVLAVDDEPDHLELTAHMLRIEGAAVVTAGNAADALVAARASPPDVLVLDIAMPETDGYELLQLLRRESGATDASLPAVALTGFASASDARRAEAAGFQAHVSKPFDVVGLRAAIMRIARKRSRKTPTR